MSVEETLAVEQARIGNACTLLRYWETDVRAPDGNSHSVSVIVYSHGYESMDGFSVRFGVYGDGRSLGGGIVA